MTWILIALIYFKMLELKVDIENILAKRPELINYKKIVTINPSDINCLSQATTTTILCTHFLQPSIACEFDLEINITLGINKSKMDEDGSGD